MGNVTGVKVDGNLTQYQFDAINRQTVTINPLNFRTTNLFDAAGNVTQVTDAQTGFNNVTTFAYDALNRVTSQTDPLVYTATFAYNAVGLLTDTTDRLGRRRAFQYDADNRVTGQTWYAAGGGVDQRLTFTYDNGDNQLTAVNGSGAYTMSYDALNRVTVVNEPFGQTLTFTYDARNQRTVVQDSQGGVTTSAYDDAGMLVERDLGGSGQPSLRVDLTYNESGQNDGVTRYNDLAGLATQVVAATSFTYDEQGRITNLHHVQGVTNIANYTYTYDAQGRVTTEVRNGTATTYAYDAADQLTGDGTNTVTYDGTGNRTNGGNTPGAGNQLTTDGTWTYTYDLEGNETKKSKGTYAETWEYTYDQQNHLLSARRWSADSGPRSLLSEVDFTYDAFGNRIETAVDSNGDGTVDTTQRYTLDGWNPAKGAPVGLENFDVLFDLNGSNVLQARYLRGDVVDQLFARVDKSGGTYTPYWTLTDHLGSVRDVTDNSGAVQGTVVYDGFGNATLSGPNTAAVGRYRFTGREFDAETGLQYNRARYYDAGTGRWTSQDPLGFDAGDSNLYRYLHNSPETNTDPSGCVVGFIRTYIKLGMALNASGSTLDWSKATKVGDTVLLTHPDEKGVQRAYYLWNVPLAQRPGVKEGSIGAMQFVKKENEKYVPTNEYICHGLTTGGYNSPVGVLNPGGKIEVKGGKSKDVYLLGLFERSGAWKPIRGIKALIGVKDTPGIVVLVKEKNSGLIVHSMLIVDLVFEIGNDGLPLRVDFNKTIVYEKREFSPQGPPLKYSEAMKRFYDYYLKDNIERSYYYAAPAN